MAAAQAQEVDSAPAAHANFSVEKVEIPLWGNGAVSSDEPVGKAFIFRLKAGSGKRGGIMKLLHPVARAESVDVLTEGEDLAGLKDLPAGIRTLLPFPELEIRGLRVRTKTDQVLLECQHASVNADGAWALRGVRLSGERILPRATLVFSEDGSAQVQASN